MRKILKNPIIPILQNRIKISRDTKVFSIEDISKGWKISRRTLYRNDTKGDDCIGT